MKIRALSIAAVLLSSACASEEPQPVAPPSDQAPAVVAPPPAAPAAPSAVTITSKSPEAVELFKRGRDLAENSRVGEATAALQQALALDPNFALANAWLGALDQSAAGLKRVDQAAALAKTLPDAERLSIESIAASKHGDADKSLELDKQTAALVPGDWRPRFQVGADLAGRRSWDAAAVELKKAIELNPKAGVVENQLGYVYGLQGKADDAIAAFKRYAEVSPTEPNAHDSLGDAYFMAGRFDEAEASYRQAIATSALFFNSWQGVAVTRYLRGDFAGGYDALAKGKAAAARPADKADMDQNVGWGLLAEGKPDGALKAFAALEKSAGDQQLAVPQALASENHAFALIESNKPADATKEIDAALDRAKSAGVSQDDLTWLGRWGMSVKAIAQAKLAKKADAEKSLAALVEIAKRDGGNPFTQSAVHLGKGMVAWAGGDAKGAVAELAQCLDDDAVCRWQLALAQTKAGDKAGTDATRAKLVALPRRDAVWVFARVKLAGKPAPPKSK